MSALLGPILMPVPPLRVQFPHLSAGEDKPFPHPYMPTSLENVLEMHPALSNLCSLEKSMCPRLKPCTEIALQRRLDLRWNFSGSPHGAPQGFWGCPFTEIPPMGRGEWSDYCGERGSACLCCSLRPPLAEEREFSPGQPRDGVGDEPLQDPGEMPGQGSRPPQVRAPCHLQP